MPKKDLIAYWGCPPPSVFALHADSEFVDLDVDLDAPSTGLVPEAYCQIITNIVDNAMLLKDSIRLILAPVGEDKCDGGRFASLILRQLGFSVEEMRNMNMNRGPISFATSDLPLSTKVNAIMDGIRTPQRLSYGTSAATHGFWGVPPHDMRLLDLFPDTTHVYGWLRCVEAGVPSDLELESMVDPGIPTVFYAQTFCQKTMLARYLADRFGGLYIDCDGPMTNSVIAKITAFIRLG